MVLRGAARGCEVCEVVREVRVRSNNARHAHVCTSIVNACRLSIIYYSSVDIRTNIRSIIDLY